MRFAPSRSTSILRSSCSKVKSSFPAVAAPSGREWKCAALTRRPEFHLETPRLEDVRRLLKAAGSPLATYVCKPDADHVNNAWLYVCENRDYHLENLTSPARRDIRRALRTFRFSFVDHKTFLEKGSRAFCDTRRRIGLSDGLPEVFDKNYAHFADNPAHHVLGAWSGDSLAGFATLVVVEDWVDIFPYSADEHLKGCPVNGLVHVILDYFLAQRKFRLINYGLSSIQEVSKATGLHAFKRKVGFECWPVHRAFVFHPLLMPFANSATLWAIRACRRLRPGSPALRKAAGMLATYLGHNPLPVDDTVASAQENSSSPRQSHDSAAGPGPEGRDGP